MTDEATQKTQDEPTDYVIAAKKGIRDRDDAARMTMSLEGMDHCFSMLRSALDTFSMMVPRSRKADREVIFEFRRELALPRESGDA